jgi:hypothetical protein
MRVRENNPIVPMVGFLVAAAVVLTATLVIWPAEPATTGWALLRVLLSVVGGIAMASLVLAAIFSWRAR